MKQSRCEFTGGLSDDASALAAGFPINETPWTASGLNYAKIMAATSQARVHIVWLQQQIEAMMDDADGRFWRQPRFPRRL